MGDSHNLAGGDFFKFTLSQASNVSITFSDPTNSGNLNPALSLYNGLFADEAHDDTSVVPLNPGHYVFNPTLQSIKDASPVDDCVTTDYMGHVYAFRDTANVTYKGQFNTLQSWSMANNSGDWIVAEYVTHVAPTGGSSVSLTDFYLPGGFYAIAAAGGTAFNAATNVNGLGGHYYV